MIPRIYKFLTALAAVPALLVVGIGALISPRWRLGLARRLALDSRPFASIRGSKLLLHLASVGEVISGEPIAREIIKRLGAASVVISTMTPTGHLEAVKRFKDIDVTFFPGDAGPIPALWLRHHRIARVILYETEMWPVFHAACADAGIPVAVINARISDRSFPRYRLLGALFRPLWRNLRVVAAQTDEYRTRLLALGVNSEQCVVTGNLKFDSSPSSISDCDPRLFAFIRGSSSISRLIIFASTHDGEESAIAEILPRIFTQFPDVRALIAPRHKERFESVWTMLRASDPTAVRRSDWDGRDARLMLLDTLGELGACFPSGYAAFIGGSLVRVGGHNVLEPARHGLPVLAGPHAFNFRAEVEALQKAGALCLVRSGHELGAALMDLLRYASLRERMGDAALRVVEEGQGAMTRTIKLLAEVGFLYPLI